MVAADTHRRFDCIGLSGDAAEVHRILSSEPVWGRNLSSMTQASRRSTKRLPSGAKARSHGTGQARGEGSRPDGVVGVEDLDPALDEIHEEVLTLILGGKATRLGPLGQKAPPATEATG